MKSFDFSKESNNQKNGGIKMDLRIDNKRIVEEIERELGYLLESKAELESHIRIGQNAKIELKETEKELQKRMATWLSIKEAI